MKNKLVLPLIVFALCPFSCKDAVEDCLPGHILILHIGEEDKPISPLILCPKDGVSLNKYKDKDVYDEDYRRLRDDSIAINYYTHVANSDLYLMLKKVLIKNEQFGVSYNNYARGAFKFIVFDQCDSVNYNILDNSIAINLFSEMLAVTEEKKFNEGIIRKIASNIWINERMVEWEKKEKEAIADDPTEKLKEQHSYVPHRPGIPKSNEELDMETKSVE